MSVPITVRELRRLSAAWGGHFFEPATMRFFNTTVRTNKLMPCGGGCSLFITREVDPTGRAGYTIREANVSKREIGTRGSFMKYKHLDDARRVAKRFARYRRHVWQSRS